MNKKAIICILSMLVLATLVVKIPIVRSEDNIGTAYEDGTLTEEELQALLDNNDEMTLVPDLTVLSQYCSSNDGYTWVVHGEVKNIGTGFAGPDYTYFFKDFGLPGVECLGRFLHILGFNPGVTKYPWSQTFQASGQTLITTFADYTDVVAESNENNNELTQYINL